jgi:hypothetical protein
MLLSSWDFPPSLQWIEPRTQKKQQEGQTYSISQCLLPPTIQRPIAQGRKDASVPKNVWAKPAYPQEQEGAAISGFVGSDDLIGAFLNHTSNGKKKHLPSKRKRSLWVELRVSNASFLLGY